jgi:hypothetical protein
MDIGYDLLGPMCLSFRPAYSYYSPVETCVHGKPVRIGQRPTLEITWIRDDRAVDEARDSSRLGVVAFRKGA